MGTVFTIHFSGTALGVKQFVVMSTNIKCDIGDLLYVRVEMLTQSLG